MPSWVAERKASRCDVTRRANATFLSPSSRAANCVDRTLTSANSDATKKPFRKTSNRIISRLNRIDPEDPSTASSPEQAETASQKGISKLIDSIAPDNEPQVGHTSKV